MVASNQSLVRSFGWAIAGIAAGWKRERNFRIHAVFAVSVGVAAWIVGSTALENAILALAIGGVMTAELLNSAVEATIDLVMRDIHPQAKYAKDVAAGAVLVMAIAAGFVGLAILAPRTLAFLATMHSGI